MTAVITTTIEVSINGKLFKFPTDKRLTILEAVDSIDHRYIIPRLCTHPDLPPISELTSVQQQQPVFIGAKCYPPSSESEDYYYEGCGLCLVEVQTSSSTDTVLQLACRTYIENGMIISTDSERLKYERQRRLVQIIEQHPHVCIVCAEREGCSREPCSLNVPVEERCCPKFGNCELQRIAEYIGLPPDLKRYIYRNLPIIKERLFTRNYNLCIGCLRCVRACQKFGAGILGYTIINSSHPLPGPIGSADINSAGCRFCTVCVEVCPTGALTDNIPVTRDELVACKQACPLAIEIPKFVNHVVNYEFELAYEVLTNCYQIPFARVLSYICPRFCERACRRQLLTESIAIRALKRAVVEYLKNNSYQQQHKSKFETGIEAKRATPNGYRIAIIGAGPSGLTAAYSLRKLNYEVTVFEADDKPGGLLQSAIPTYRLPPEVLERDLQDILEVGGIKLELNCKVGHDIEFQKCVADYDAVLIATGCPVSRKLAIPNADAEGVYSGLELLQMIKKEPEKVKNLNLGRRIVIVGGGNVAFDIARSLLRLDSSRRSRCRHHQITIVYRRSQDELPADPDEREQAECEGIRLLYLTQPIKICLGQEGKVKGIECIRTELSSELDSDGRRKFVPIAGTEFMIETDSVIYAIGETSDLTFIPTDDTTITTATAFPPSDDNGKNKLKVDAKTLVTTISEKVFACGDVIHNRSTSVAEAIASGLQAAQSIDKYLRGDRSSASTAITTNTINTTNITNTTTSHSTTATKQLPSVKKKGRALKSNKRFGDLHRIPTTKLEPAECINSFKLVELGYTNIEAAVEEASRCLRCNLRAELTPPKLPPQQPSASVCDLSYRESSASGLNEFTPEAIQKVPNDAGVFQLFDASQQEIIYIKGVNDLQTELTMQFDQFKHDAKYFSYELDPMYTKRESELLQQYIQKHGRMPKYNDLTEEDLF